MNKKLLLAALLIILSFSTASVWAQKNSKAAFIKYTINGKQYSYGSDDVNCYYKKGDRYETDNRDFHETVGYVSTIANGTEKLTFTIRTEVNTKPVVSTMKHQGILTNTKVLPNVYMNVDKLVGGEYTFYGSKNNTPGTFEITKVEGDWIEGTFEAELPNTYDDENDPPIKITNGSFRIQMSDF